MLIKKKSFRVLVWLYVVVILDFKKKLVSSWPKAVLVKV